MFAYLNLTKPRISLLVAITGLAALIVEGSLLADPLRVVLVIAALFLTAGSANAFNQYFEREIDQRMERTAKKRSLPLGKVSPQQALIFSFVTGIIGCWGLYAWGGRLASGLGLATILYYSLYYTLWLKPRTPYNIVIGGAAGAMGPIIGWAAATGQVSWISLLMFMIIFVWTPPHFWALALCCKEDYQKVSYPMLPIVAGDAMTRKQILYYAVTLVPFAVGLAFFRELGSIYLAGSIILSLLFVLGAYQVYRKKNLKTYWQFFGFSILYLLLLFVLMIVDVLVLA